MSQTRLEPGSTFAGYRIEEEVGRGGMGVVYRATDLQLERLVALKLIAPELAEDPGFRERFLRESRLAASLGHPHVLPVYAAGEHEGQLYLAMRYVEGSDLKTVIERERQLDPERALKICPPIAEALDAAHEKGLVHRDVKPGNVLLDEHEQAYLADFGLTKQVGSASAQTGHLVGTLDYLAPEQIRGEELDGRTDEYALGCVLYECLSGSPPFRRQTEAEVLWGHMQEEPPPLREYPALDPVLKKGLAKERDDRYPACIDLVDSAREALGFETARLRRHRRMIRSSRALLAAGVLVLAGAIAALVVELTVRGSSTRVQAAQPDSLAVVDPATNHVTAQVPIPGGPSFVAAGRGSVWVVSNSSRTISAVSPEKLAVSHVVSLRAAPSALAMDGPSVWAYEADARELLRVDPAYGAVTRRISLPLAEDAVAIQGRVLPSVAVDGRVLWVTDGSSRLLRIDAVTGQMLATLDVHEPLDYVAVGGGAVWATSGRAAAVFEIDRRARRVEARVNLVSRPGTTAPLPVAAVVGEGAVWVLSLNTDTVTKVDPTLGGVETTIPLGIDSGPTAIAAGAGAVWVANGGNGTLARIDPQTNDVTAVPVGSSPSGVAVEGGRVWVTVQPGFRATVRPASSSVSGLGSMALPTSFCSGVEFQGEGRPEYLVASDLPFQGNPTLAQTLQFSDAIRFVLAEHHYRAGRYSVGYQSCDDSSAQVGGWSPETCARNAKAYAVRPSLLGVVGGYNSGCVEIEVPILERAPAGPLALISPTATYVGLTHSGPGTAPDEPQKYYPHRVRNFARVVVADDLQGAADALVAKQLGVRRLYLLDDGGTYGEGIATDTGAAARKLGIAIAGAASWVPGAATYAPLARTIRRTRADGVFLGGEVDTGGAVVEKTLREVLGPEVRMLTPDGFTPISAFLQMAGPAAEGATISFPGLTPSGLPREGRRFVAAFEKAIGRPVEAYSIAAAQATEVLVDAIARSDGTRASVTSELLKTNVKNGILGSFSIDRNGDTTAGAVTIYRIEHGKPVVLKVITPPARLVR